MKCKERDKTKNPKNILQLLHCLLQMQVDSFKSLSSKFANFTDKDFGAISRICSSLCYLSILGFWLLYDPNLNCRHGV